MNLDKTLTIDDLITAFVEYEEYKNWHESYAELIDYYKTQLKLMQKLFDCDLQKAKEYLDGKQDFNNFDNPEIHYEFHGGMTVNAFKNCIKLLKSFKSPFDYRGLLAGMPPKICRDLMDKYGENLEQSIKNLESTYRKIAKDLLIFMFPGIESKQINGAILYDLGLPLEEPDIVDFF
jgi:hypothetical protein